MTSLQPHGASRVKMKVFDDISVRVNLPELIMSCDNLALLSNYLLPVPHLSICVLLFYSSVGRTSIRSGRLKYPSHSALLI